MSSKFSIQKRGQSFIYAWRGILCLIRNEHNAWIHISILTAVVFAGFYFRITAIEWVCIIIVSALVLALETVNTAIEKLCNHICPEQHNSIAIIKDLAAGAVLIAAISAAVVGLIIFLPYIIQ